jgi:rhamnosyltransferase
MVDNSPQPVFPDSSEFNPDGLNFRLIVSHRPENIGVSSAIAYAFKLAKESGYQFVWLMDHDSIPSPVSHDLLLRAMDAYPDAALVACQPKIEPNGKLLNGLIFQDYRFVPKATSLAQDLAPVPVYECDAVITSGSLLSIERIGTLGIVDENLFIDAVDHDICWRIRAAGLRVMVVRDAVMSHQLGQFKEIWDGFKKHTIQLSSYSYLRLYYICRNHTHVEIKAAKGSWKLMALLWRIRFCLWQIKMNYLEGDDALRKSIYCLLGSLHGFIGKLGKHPLSSPKSLEKLNES